MNNTYKPIQKNSMPFKLKLYAKIWGIVNKTFFRYGLFFSRKFRIHLLNFFGAKIHNTCSINRNTIIDYPWNLTMGEKSSLGINTWAYCLDKITIGENCCIGNEVYLLTGSHNIKSSTFELVTHPIIIGNGVWISTRANILPKVSIGDFTVIAMGSVVTKNTEKFDVIGGNPAKFIKKRKISE